MMKRHIGLVAVLLLATATLHGMELPVEKAPVEKKALPKQKIKIQLYWNNKPKGEVVELTKVQLAELASPSAMVEDLGGFESAVKEGTIVPLYLQEPKEGKASYSPDTFLVLVSLLSEDNLEAWQKAESKRAFVNALIEKKISDKKPEDVAAFINLISFFGVENPYSKSLLEVALQQLAKKYWRKIDLISDDTSLAPPLFAKTYLKEEALQNLFVKRVAALEDQKNDLKMLCVSGIGEYYDVETIPKDLQELENKFSQAFQKFMEERMIDRYGLFYGQKKVVCLFAEDTGLSLNDLKEKYLSEDKWTLFDDYVLRSPTSAIKTFSDVIEYFDGIWPSKFIEAMKQILEERLKIEKVRQEERSVEDIKLMIQNRTKKLEEISSEYDYGDDYDQDSDGYD